MSRLSQKDIINADKEVAQLTGEQNLESVEKARRDAVSEMTCEGYEDTTPSPLKEIKWVGLGIASFVSHLATMSPTKLPPLRSIRQGKKHISHA